MTEIHSWASSTVRLSTEKGKIYITVSTNEEGKPYQIFSSVGKAGSFQYGMTEAICRLIALHFRQETPLEEIIQQLEGIQDGQPFPNELTDGQTIQVKGIADGIAQILKKYL